MKKNVKILGAAAAALLAVAPIAASATTANAAISFGGNPSSVAAPTHPAAAYTLGGDGNIAVTKDTKVSSLLNASTVINNLHLTSSVSGDNPTITGNPSNIQVVNSDGQYLSGDDTLVPGQQYYLTARVTISGLTGRKEYHAGSAIINTNPNGVTTSQVQVSITLSGYDANAVGTPYFYDLFANNKRINNGSFANSTLAIQSNISGIQKEVDRAVQARVSDENGHVTVLNAEPASSIRSQLSNQGITVESDGSIPSSARNFTLTYQATNTVNNQTATVKLQFVRPVNNQGYPIVYEGSNQIKQGNQWWNGYSNDNLPVVTVAAGSQRANAIAADGTLGWSARNVFAGNSGNADLAVVSNHVNANVAGVYPVTLRATNANGYTTVLTYNVVVTPSKGYNAKVQYVAGYGVNVWNVLGDNSVAYAGYRVDNGTNVRVLDTRTVNGVSYSRIGANAWIQTQYLDGSWNAKPATPATPAKPVSSETAMSGVARVTYRGKGGVNLLNADGKYQNQYVKKGSSWKVFASKTINGETMYRLGTQNQWIPAKYVSVR